MRLKECELNNTLRKFTEYIKEPGNYYYDILSEMVGTTIEGEFDLIATLRELAGRKKEYESIATACDQVKGKGYGIVPPTEDEIQIVISKGDDSGTVSRKLYNAGLIENAAEYDAFLMQHGYDKKISTGTKIIYATDSWQEIAEKLTSK